MLTARKTVVSFSLWTSFRVLGALGVLGIAGALGGCGAEEDPPAIEQAPSALAALAPNPPPASCDQRYAGVTALQALVRIDEYKGLISGRNGVHEIAYGTITATPWVYDSSVLDTSNVQLALNVKSAKDPSGLPHEIRLSAGQTVEVEGEYIPSSAASAHDARGRAAVLHFTHAPCGYITIGGTVYR